MKGLATVVYLTSLLERTINRSFSQEQDNKGVNKSTFQQEKGKEMVLNSKRGKADYVCHKLGGSHNERICRKLFFSELLLPLFQSF